MDVQTDIVKFKDTIKNIEGPDYNMSSWIKYPANFPVTSSGGIDTPTLENDIEALLYFIQTLLFANDLETVGLKPGEPPQLPPSPQLKSQISAIDGDLIPNQNDYNNFRGKTGGAVWTTQNQQLLNKLGTDYLLSWLSQTSPSPQRITGGILGKQYIIKIADCGSYEPGKQKILQINNKSGFKDWSILGVPDNAFPNKPGEGFNGLVPGILSDIIELNPFQVVDTALGLPNSNITDVNCNEGGVNLQSWEGFSNYNNYKNESNKNIFISLIIIIFFFIIFKNF